MKKNKEEIRTYPSKGLVLFLSAVIILSLAISTGVYFIKDSLALKIVIWIFCLVFFVLSLIVLLNEAVIYLSISKENDCLVIHKFLRSKKIYFNELSRIENKDGYYVFLKGKNEVHRIGTSVNGINPLIVALEKRGIKIEWQKF